MDYGFSVTCSNTALLDIYYDTSGGVWMYNAKAVGNVTVQVLKNGVAIDAVAISVKA